MPAVLASILIPSCLGFASFPVGSSWSYAGTRLWSDSARVDSGTVRWKTELVAARPVGGGRLLLIRGFVAELAWSDPATVPRLSLLFCRSGRLDYLRFSSDSLAREAFDRWADSLLTRAELLVQEPLNDGDVQGQSPKRDDQLYGWAVEVLPRQSAQLLGCGRAGSAGYRLTMRTLPDHQVVEWRDGIGITGYIYGHHGTAAGASVNLVACALNPLRREP
jgi:hypothetical protein